jgi:hypothetical protein
MDYENYIECHEENMLEAGANIVIEAEQNWNAIMKAVGIEEVRAYAEGTEVITEAGRIGGMLDKAKQFFQNLWQKVVGMFKKLLSILDQQAKKDKDFVKKYRADVQKVMSKKDWNENLSIKYYPFKSGDTTLGNWVSKVEGNLKTGLGVDNFECNVDGLSDKEINDIDSLSWKDEINDKVRGIALGSNSTESESEFRKEMKEKIYGDLDSSKDITQELVTTAFNEIDGSEQAKKTLKQTFKTIDDTLKTTIKNVEKAQRNFKFKDNNDKDLEGAALTNATKKYAAIGTVLSISKAAQTTLTTVYSMECQAIKDRNRQARAIVGKVYRRPVKEGFEHFEEGATYGNAFDSIRLV